MKRNRISQKLRREMNRSGTCKCDICLSSNILVIHHINGRKIKYPNHVSNIANICSNCHRKVHQKVIILEGWFKTTNGLELLWYLNDNISQSLSGNSVQTYIIPTKKKEELSIIR